MIKKVTISKSNSSKALAFFDELSKKKVETIKKVEEKTKHLRERLIETNGRKPAV